MNLFIYWENEKGELELRTAPLDGTILPGITRDSVLTITREWNRFNVVEKPFYMNDVVKAAEEDRIIEMFGAGTVFILIFLGIVFFEIVTKIVKTKKRKKLETTLYSSDSLPS